MFRFSKKLSATLIPATLLGLWLLSPNATYPIGPSNIDRSLVAVIDGDTLDIAGQIVQLYGIDAPELGQRCLHDGVWEKCGQNAAFELKKLIEIGFLPMVCRQPDPGDESDAARVCLIGHKDIGFVLLETGYVLTTPDARLGYKDTEGQARESHLGVWHSDFVHPLEWRKGKRLDGEIEAENNSCPIKAITKADGERVYLVPTDENYELIAVSQSNGDRYFCSDEEARVEGWRHQPGVIDEN